MVARSVEIEPCPISLRAKDITAIKNSWGIDTDTCNKICIALHQGLQERDILGVKLQGFGTRHKFREVVVNIQKHLQDQDIFKDSNVDQNLIQQGLRQMAQILNQNKRRQINRMRRNQDSRNSIKDDKEKYSIPHNKMMNVAPLLSTVRICDGTVGSKAHTVGPSVISSDFSNTAIVVRRQFGGTMSCRPCDFCLDHCEQLSVDHLQFNRFLEILADELEFNAEMDTIFYQLRSGERISVRNERAWRAAMWDMYSKGDRDLVFNIGQRAQSDTTQ